MNVTMLRYTINPDELSGQAAALCTNFEGDPLKALRGGMDRGHKSIAEHVSFTFLVEGVSRALLAQLTRHRIASFSVQSQRYVSLDDCFEYVTPPSIVALGPAQVLEYKRQMIQMHNWYCQWQTRLGGPSEKANEDARFVLPNAAATRLMVTMNARELLHFFELRCCNRAQWEIRQMARMMLMECRSIAPEIFKGAGPACVRGACPEGKHSCGQPMGGELG